MSADIPGSRLSSRDHAGTGSGPDAPAQAGAPASPLPCLKSDNSNRETEDDAKKQERLADRMRYQAKAGMTLALNAKAFIERFGLERVGFLTLTLADHLDWRNKGEWQEAERRFHSLQTGYLRKRFSERITVLEPQRGNDWRIHWHLLVNVGQDIRTGFDFEAVKQRDYRSASPALRGLWDELRETLPRYGFGRSELLPLKKDSESVAVYLGKYLSKDGWQAALAQEFKARRVRYTHGWTVANMRWSWNCDGARIWRQSLRLVAEAVGCSNLCQFELWAKKHFGPKWAYHLRGTIIELGTLPAAGPHSAQLKFIVRDLLDVAKLPEHLRADTARVLAALGMT
jgi:hypothetical protein